jgi:hypothetical protein
MKIQRLWIGAITRYWLRDCHSAATFIQKHFRGLLVRTVLGDKAGRELHRKFKKQLVEMMKKKEDMEESVYIAKVTAFMGRVRSHLHDRRIQNINMRRMQSYSLRSAIRKSADKERKLRMKGALQPARISVFEPMAIALRSLDPPKVRLDKSTRVMKLVITQKKVLDRTMPQEITNKRPHAAARRGRAALYARRIAKKPKEDARAVSSGMDLGMFSYWSSKQFSKQFSSSSGSPSPRQQPISPGRQ